MDTADRSEATRRTRELTEAAWNRGWGGEHTDDDAPPSTAAPGAEPAQCGGDHEEDDANDEDAPSRVVAPGAGRCRTPERYQSDGTTPQ